MAADAVDHPAHYGGAANPYEVIKVLEAWLTPDEYIGFLKGNALKYLARHRQKGGDEDLRKAEWYNRELNRFQAERQKSKPSLTKPTFAPSPQAWDGRE